MSKRTSNIGAGVAGGGCGLVLAHLASHLPDVFWWKQYAIDLVPALSITVSGTLVFLRTVAQDYWRNRTSDVFYKTAKQTFLDGLNNPVTSQAHKQELAKKLEKLEKMHADKALARYMAEP
jgi:hypothetical protein